MATQRKVRVARAKKLPMEVLRWCPRYFPAAFRVSMSHSTSAANQLATEGRADRLSRPSCFGKSLLLSALGAYFEGRRELFKGLSIAQLRYSAFAPKRVR